MHELFKLIKHKLPLFFILNENGFQLDTLHLHISFSLFIFHMFVITNIFFCSLYLLFSVWFWKSCSNNYALRYCFYYCYFKQITTVINHTQVHSANAYTLLSKTITNFLTNLIPKIMWEGKIKQTSSCFCRVIDKIRKKNNKKHSHISRIIQN